MLVFDSMHNYYDRRADEYEAIYHRDDPVRQNEQAAIALALKDVLRGRNVLEVACGTGFWTAFAAEVAEHIVAIDSAPGMLRIARAKGLNPDQVEFREADAYHLSAVAGTFDAALANFWFSHVPKIRIAQFLDGLHRKLAPGSVVFMADNVYVPGIGGELVTRPGTEDTFKRRTLSDGSVSEVLKNYYDADLLRGIFKPVGCDLRIHAGACFWWLRYETAAEKSATTNRSGGLRKAP